MPEGSAPQSRPAWMLFSGSWARVLPPDREPVKDVKCSDHGHAQERYQEAEQGAYRKPGQGQLKSPADGRRVRRVKGFAEQPVTARVLPDGVERQGRRVDRTARARQAGAAGSCSPSGA